MTTTLPGYQDFRVAAPAAYDNVFSHFYFAKNNTGQAITKTLLPSFQTILVFNFGTTASLYSKKQVEIRLNKCIVLGPIKKAFDYTLPSGAEILVVSFKDDAFYRFFGNASIAEHLPLHPDGLLTEDCFTGLWFELNKINDNDLRIQHILRFANPYLSNRNKIAEQLAGCITQVLSPIKTVAMANKQTERNTQLSQKKHFGYSAKEFNRYSRFLKAIELIRQLATNNSRLDWFAVIDECGYYDQSQLIHDFKHYINLSPAKYLNFQKDICG